MPRFEPLFLAHLLVRLSHAEPPCPPCRLPSRLPPDSVLTVFITCRIFSPRCWHPLYPSGSAFAALTGHPTSALEPPLYAAPCFMYNHCFMNASMNALVELLRRRTSIRVLLLLLFLLLLCKECSLLLLSCNEGPRLLPSYYVECAMRACERGCNAWEGGSGGMRSNWMGCS